MSAPHAIPGVFNLGGDLALFVLLIKSREREALAHYAKLCIDNVYARVQNYHCPWLTTISLVQGDALGGGLRDRAVLRRHHCRGKARSWVCRRFCST